ncbi:hypothetical protein M1446_03155 [Candidatus Dependentiae bacterium]|nr:hypothetical protein [Candidatus Dependentiae bacterium]
MTPEEKKKYLVMPAFQTLIIIIVSIVISVAVYKASSKFLFEETRPELLNLNPTELTRNFGEIQTPIDVGLYLNNFSNFDMVKGEFTFSGVIWFKFDPAAISLETIGNFSFDKGEILEKSAPYTQIVDNKLFARYNIKVKFASALKYSRFPIDNHSIFIVLDNKFLYPNDAFFRAGKKDFIIKPDMRHIGWNQLDTSVDAGITKLVLEEFDKKTDVYNLRTVFKINYLRTDTKYFITIFIPLIMIFFLSLFTFSLDPDQYSAGSSLGLATGGVTGIIAFKFVIESMSPQVGYFMLSDYLYFLFFIAIMLIFFFYLVLYRLKLNSTYIVLALQTFVLLSTVYFLLWGI